MERADMAGGLRPIRRVVTGHDAKHVAKPLIDGPASNAKYPAAGIVSTLLWSTDRMPTDIAAGEGIEDLGARILGSAPPPNGSRFCVLDIAPGAPAVMHRTETLDYVLVLAGEIEMDMDHATLKLGPGDILIQRGTNHAWVNRSAAPARIAVVLMDAAPLGIGHAVTGMVSAGDDHR
jgi:quercetin dioxygenase-like cupin family protein